MEISKKQKIGLGLVGLLALVSFGLYKATSVKTQTDEVASKFKYDFGTLRIHDISIGKITFAVDGIKVYNQSSISATISNLYINIKNMGSQLFTQENYLSTLEIPANATTTLPSMYFSMPTTSVLTLWDIYNNIASQNLDVNVRFQVLGGYEISLDNHVDIRGQMAMLKNIFDNTIVKWFLPKSTTEAKPQEEGGGAPGTGNPPPPPPPPIADQQKPNDTGGYGAGYDEEPPTADTTPNINPLEISNIANNARKFMLRGLFKA